MGYDKAVRIAAVCHEANRAYCQTIGDTSQPAWDEAPGWQHDSVVAGVKQVLADPETTPEESHLGWSRQKLAEGWTYGPVKDPSIKQHPCLVPYAELPEEQRRKDALFGAVVHALM
jgi:hypothetical protein